MRRVRELIDWRFLLATAFLALVVQMGFNSWEHAQQNEALVAQLKRDRATAASERHEASQERRQLVEGQDQLRRDYQLLLDYLESAGVAVPPNLARAITLGSSGRNSSDDDDDDGDTNITVRPQMSGGSSPSSNPPSSVPSDDPDPVEDLTDQIGGTVDETRKMTEDTIRDLTDNLGDIVEP